MTLASVGTLGGSGFKATQTSMTLALAAQADAGNLVVLVIGLDNATGDATGVTVTSVTDTQSNNWLLMDEFTGTGAAAGCATVSVWFSHITTSIPITTGVITANFSSRGAGAITAWEFTKASNTVINLTGRNEDRNPTTGTSTAIMNSSLNVTTPNKEHLRFRGAAGEEELTTTGTATSTWTLIGVTGTSGTGGLNTSNIITRGEFLISTATGAASAPTAGVSCDWASVYAAISEENSHPNGWGW